MFLTSVDVIKPFCAGSFYWENHSVLPLYIVNSPYLGTVVFFVFRTLWLPQFSSSPIFPYSFYAKLAKTFVRSGSDPTLEEFESLQSLSWAYTLTWSAVSTWWGYNLSAIGSEGRGTYVNLRGGILSFNIGFLWWIHLRVWFLWSWPYTQCR